jgi:hypothetical protein
MDYVENFETKAAVAAALGIGVGGLAGWTFGESGRLVDWAVWLLLTYIVGINVLVTAIEHEQGFFRGLTTGLGRLISFLGALQDC